MYKFGKKSQERLDTCHPHLQQILKIAIKQVDFTVLCGYRTEDEQDDAYKQGRSKVQYPNSRHNQNPSVAVDIAPYPIDWDNITRFAHLIGIIKGIAQAQDIKIRCGCDWDMDGDITDHSFMDWPHIELVME
jgi:peptidoglycan L-alanyl-D-glutamate endopeptidase CwlK